MKTHFIDLHVHTIYSQEETASLGIKETLDYYQTLGLRSNGRVIIRINDHNTIFGGVHAVEYYMAHREDYPNLFVIPGIEFSTNMGYALKFKKKDYVKDPEYPDSDDKYSFVFKSAHIGAAPIINSEESLKHWKENQDLVVYSKLQKMFLDRTIKDGKYYFEDSVVNYSEEQMYTMSNVGDWVCSCKNKIRKMFGVIIPYREYYGCVQDGLDADQIMCKFFEVSCSYLKEHYKPFAQLNLRQIYDKVSKVVEDEYNQISHKERIKAFLGEFSNVFDFSKTEIEKIIDAPFISLREKFNDILQLFDTNYFKEGDEFLRERMVNVINSFLKFPNCHINLGGSRKINIDELCQIVKEAGGIIDFEHPNVGIKLHYKKEHDPISQQIISVHTTPVPTSFFSDIDFSVMKKEDKQNLLGQIASNEFIEIGDVLKYDRTGLVAVQIIKKALDNQGITFNNNYVGVEIPKFAAEFAYSKLEIILNIMAKKRFLPSVGFDKHMANYDYYYQFIKDKEHLDELTSFYKNPEDFYYQIRQLERKIGHNLEEVSHFDTYTDFCVNKDSTVLRMPLVKKCAFCDAVMGKHVDFNSSTLLDLRLGMEKPEEDETFEVISEFEAFKQRKRELMTIVYKDLHSYSLKFQQSKLLTDFVSEMAEKSKKYVSNLKWTELKDDTDSSKILGNLIQENRKQLLDAWNNGEFIEKTK